jgi:hypothetical protein
VTDVTLTGLDQRSNVGRVRAPTTTRQFRTQVESLIRKRNPQAKSLVIEWTFGPQAVTFPTGYKGYTGGVLLTDPDYKPRRMSASFVEGGGLLVN